VIQDDTHLLVVLRCIEANLLRAKIVADPAEYRWSSYLCHGLGRDDPLLSPFPEWEKRGRTDAERRRLWRAKVCAAQSESDLMSVRGSLRTGRPFGALDWTQQMAGRLNIALVPRPRSRPRKEKMNGHHLWTEFGAHRAPYETADEASGTDSCATGDASGRSGLLSDPDRLDLGHSTALAHLRKSVSVRFSLHSKNEPAPFV
jgi:hypothetical protein